MAHHDIPVILIENPPGSGNRLPIPQIPPPGIIHVGDTVRYTSVDGALSVVFELPFSDVTDVVPGGEIRLMTRAGNFFCKCFVTVQGQGGKADEELGWSPATPKAGGEHDVRP